MNKRIGIILALILILLGVVGCNISEENIDTNHLVLSYTEWESEVASTTVLKLAMEDRGYTVELIPLENAFMWLAVSSSDADAMISGWLPATHKAQYEQYGGNMIDLGPNLQRAKIGLVVPEYFDIDSIEDLDDQVDKKIMGIEAGAGVVQAAEQALEDYDNLSDWEVVPSSTGAMIAEMESAIDKEENIVITGWSPHWKFEKHDLKYIEDPKGSFGAEEDIRTLVREGLREDKPEIYDILDKFHWDIEDMQGVMADMADGMAPEEASRKWINNNEELVNSWFE